MSTPRHIGGNARHSASYGPLVLLGSSSRILTRACVWRSTTVLVLFVFEPCGGSDRCRVASGADSPVLPRIERG